MACTLSNKCAKNLSKQTVLYFNLSSKTWSHVFWNTVYNSEVAWCWQQVVYVLTKNYETAMA